MKSRLVETVTAPDPKAVPDFLLCAKCGRATPTLLCPIRSATVPPGVVQKSVHCPKCGTLLARTIAGHDVSVEPKGEGTDPRLRPGIVTDPDAIRAAALAELEAKVAELEAKLPTPDPAPDA